MNPVPSFDGSVDELTSRGLVGARIVIAEDNSLVRSLFAFWLGELGAEVVAVGDGLAALEAVRRVKADVLLTDETMPKLRGAELIRLLRSEGPLGARVRVIVVSADARLLEESRSIADGFLPKPCERADLVRAVAEVLGRESFRSQADLPAPSEGPAGPHPLERAFRSEAHRIEGELREACKGANWREVAHLAHSLANSAFAVQDLLLSADAARLERAARHGVPDAREFEAVLAGIGRHLSRHSTGPFSPPQEQSS